MANLGLGLNLSKRLCYVCENGPHNDVQYLLSFEQTNPNFHNTYGLTPLYIACQKGHTETVKLLLNDRRVEVNEVEWNHKQTPFYIACAMGRKEIVEELLKDERINRDAPNNEGITPMEIACLNGEHLVLELLEDAGFGLNERESQDNYWVRLVLACRKGDVDLVKLLLKDERIELHKEDKNGNTVFNYACMSGHVEIVKLLLSNDRIDVNKTDKERKTPFFKVCFNEDTDLIELLLDNERIDINKVGDRCQTTLQFCCETGCTEIVEVLLKSTRIDVNKPDDNGRTPLYTACYNEYASIVELLLKDKRVDVNQVTYFGATPFYNACQIHFLEGIQLFLNNPRVDLNKPKNSGWTPFYVACWKGYPQIVEILLSSDRINEDHKRLACERIAMYSEEHELEWDEGDDETEDDWNEDINFESKRDAYITISRMYEEYQRDPKQTKFEIRKRLGFLDQLSKEIYCMIVLVSDNYLKIPVNPSYN